MFDGSSWDINNQRIWEEEKTKEKRIEDFELSEFTLIPGLRFLFGLFLAVFLFLIPIPLGGNVIVLFDVVLGIVVELLGIYASWIGLGLAAYAALLTIISILHSRNIISVDEKIADFTSLTYWETNVLFTVIRILGVIFLGMLALQLGPDWLYPSFALELWTDLLPLALAVLPLGAIVVKLLVDMGGLDFIGTLAQPLMRPFFKLPGRSSLDTLASIFGSPIVGYYVTDNVFSEGGYSKQHVYVLTTCFAPPTLATVALVAGLLDILHLLPLIIVTWLLSIFVTGFVLVRVPPLNKVPNYYVSEPETEPRFSGTPGDYFKLAKTRAVNRAKGESIIRSGYAGFIEGLKMGAIVIGVLAAFAYPVALIFEITDIFETMATPIVPIIDTLGIPDAEVVSVALVTGLGIEILPALVASEAGVGSTAAFFITVVSVSQMIYVATSIPVIMDIFQEVPIRLRDLIIIGIIRFFVLIVVVATITQLLVQVGIL